MSYILDALRRAEAERGRGAVPGLHTQAVPVPGAAPVAGRSATTPALVAAAVVAVVAAIAAGAWWAMQRPAPAGTVVAASPASPAPAAAPVAPAAPITPAAPVPATEPLRAAAPPQSEPRPAERRKTEPAREKPAPAPSVPRAAQTEPARTPAVAPLPTPPKEPAAAAAPTGTVFAQTDLPDAVRSQLPTLKISGVTYSSNPAYRMAIVNGQVLHEGDPAGPGLLLEKIEPSRTVWSFKGYRYGLASQ